MRVTLVEMPCLETSVKGKEHSEHIYALQFQSHGNQEDFIVLVAFDLEISK